MTAKPLARRKLHALNAHTGPKSEVSAKSNQQEKTSPVNKSKQVANKTSLKKKYAKNFFKLLLAAYLTLNILGPVAIYIFPEIMSHMIFENFIHFPFKNLSNPMEFGLENTYTFKLDHDEVQLGAWHIMPSNQQMIDTHSLEEHFKVNIPYEKDKIPIVVLYLHGNTNDRSTGHRLELYKVLRELDYHIVAVDYRGYGDSSGYPTERDVVKDALYTYEYIKELVPWATVYVWGHSLGTGITSSMARTLSDKGKPPVGIILESPFFNIVEEVELHPFTWVFAMNKIMLHVIEEALISLELQFRSDIHLKKVESKILMLHAEDDMVIPIYQADKLYEIISKQGISKNVTYHRIPFHHWCGHRNIYTAPNITQIIKSFIH